MSKLSAENENLLKRIGLGQIRKGNTKEIETNDPFTRKFVDESVFGPDGNLILARVHLELKVVSIEYVKEDEV